MNIFEPLQIIRGGEPSGLWHMTCRSDEDGGGPMATGLCALGCPGHASPQEAVQHFRQGLVAEGFHGTDPRVKMQCVVCGEWQHGFFHVDNVAIPACVKCASPEAMLAAYNQKLTRQNHVQSCQAN